MIRRTLSLVIAALIAFHLWVLGDQLWQGALSDPALAARWLVAGGLVWAAIALRRRGVSLVWGRRAVAVWSLTALLHGPAFLDSAARGEPILPEIAATLATITVVSAAGVGLVFLIAGLMARRRTPSGQLAVLRRHFSSPQVQLRAFVVLSPRPPPAR